MKKIPNILAIIIVAMISGCNGGGGDSASNNVPTPVVNTAKLKFNSSVVKMIVSGAADGRHRILNLQYMGDTLNNPVQVKLSSSDPKNLILKNDKCEFTSSIKNCQIDITTGDISANYLITGKADGYTIDPVSVNVYNKNQITFDKSSTNILLGGTDIYKLEMHGTDSSTVSQKVQLSANGGVAISPSSCTLGYSTQSCEIKVKAESAGAFQVTGQVVNPSTNHYILSLAPINGNIVKEGTISLLADDNSMLTHSSKLVTLQLYGATLKPINVSLSTSAGIQIESGMAGCNLSHENESCSFIVNSGAVSTGNDGTFDVIAKADGHVIEPLPLHILARGTLHWDKSQLNLPLGKSEQVILSIAGANKLDNADLTLSANDNAVSLDKNKCVLIVALLNVSTLR